MFQIGFQIEAQFGLSEKFQDTILKRIRGIYPSAMGNIFPQLKSLKLMIWSSSFAICGSLLYSSWLPRFHYYNRVCTLNSIVEVQRDQR